MASIQAAWSKLLLSPAPGALTIGEQEAKRRSLAVLSSHEAGSPEERVELSGLLWLSDPTHGYVGQQMSCLISRRATPLPLGKSE